jgi:hypothetical protein
MGLVAASEDGKVLCNGVAHDGVEPCFDGDVNGANHGGLVGLGGLGARGWNRQERKAKNGELKTKNRGSFHDPH